MAFTAATKTFIDALLAETASTISALTGLPTSVTDGAAPAGPAWIVSLGVSGASKGACTLMLDAAGTDALARAVLGSEGQITPATVSGLLREMVVQAVGALGQQPPFADVAVSVDRIEQGAVQANDAATFAIVVGGDGRLVTTVAANIEPVGRAIAPTAVSPASTAMAPAVDRGLPAGQPGNWDAVLDIDLPLRVRFGVTEMSVRALSALGPGSIVDMGRGPDDPVEILVCGRVIARAEVVVVDGNYGVRVTDLLSASERLKALEGQW